MGELRGLQTIAQSQLTLETVDRIRIRLEPLREELDDLVKNASESVLDGALEQAAQLERNLRSVLDDLETARITENEVKQAVEEEEVVQEELVAEVEAEPTQSEVAEPEPVEAAVVAEAEPEVVEQPEIEAIKEEEPVATPEVVKAIVDEVSQEDIETNEVPRTSVVEDVNHLVEEASPAA